MELWTKEICGCPQCGVLRCALIYNLPVKQQTITWITFGTKTIYKYYYFHPININLSSFHVTKLAASFFLVVLEVVLFA